jgi:muconate cycloisomerase
MTIKIASLTPIALDLPLAKPIRLSDMEIATSENLLVRLEADDGVVGWGEAPAAPTMTGETVARLVAAIDYLAPAVVGRAFDDPAALVRAMDDRLYANQSAKSAIEMAAFDVAGKSAGRPLVEMLGGVRRERIPVLWMLGKGEAEADIEDGRRKMQFGFQSFKIKVGVNPVAVDADRCRRIRAALGDMVMLSADANQAWTVDQALDFVRRAEDARLDFLEQPVNGADVAGMARVAAATATPLGADEGLHGIADIERHHQANAARGGSLKLIKFGGLERTSEAAGLSDALGMKVNLAGKIAESSVATAALLHLAGAVPAIDWGLSLSSQYLAADIAAEPIEIVDGHARLPTSPGLGIEVDEDAVKRFARAA